MQTRFCMGLVAPKEAAAKEAALRKWHMAKEEWRREGYSSGVMDGENAVAVRIRQNPSKLHLHMVRVLTAHELVW